MTKTEFHKLLVVCSKQSFDFAKNYILDSLPSDFKFNVILNASNDDPTLKQFDLYPMDNGKIVKQISLTDAIELLYRKGKVPVWINISVCSIYKNSTVFELLCSGRYSSDTNEFYYSKQGTGPFGIKSPVFPLGFKDDGTKFHLMKKKSFLNWLTNK
jgi:hypothetical protein